ncbi:hypothetical protein Mp_2g20060 [Marchantia polymorpha subsp. ruderalis]|uniref:Uncharacterized protein n=1 Tax=Marchantia polymorpha TaxID=3197 RepID=A0A2R6WV85_MARPO|nr:hypothetical protein MARPO_0055s0043 [Marchantia polymorpha]BBN03024.1 hypothetical protein Mp_2g20060 [Marchantia polymorpha subsp. ruderalis]|eukprot:PTQ37764.1 hypothetical protein MARPO_0055s0043 [Marchantia polymorpha]
MRAERTRPRAEDRHSTFASVRVRTVHANRLAGAGCALQRHRNPTLSNRPRIEFAAGLRARSRAMAPLSLSPDSHARTHPGRGLWLRHHRSIELRLASVEFSNERSPWPLISQSVADLPAAQSASTTRLNAGQQF